MSLRQNISKSNETYNFKLLLDFPADIDVVSSHTFDGEQTSAVERYLGEDGGISEVQVWIGAEGHLAGPHPPRAAPAVLLACHGIGRRGDVPARIAILLEEFSSDQLVYDERNIGEGESEESK